MKYLVIVTMLIMLLACGSDNASDKTAIIDSVNNTNSIPDTSEIEQNVSDIQGQWSCEFRMPKIKFYKYQRKHNMKCIGETTYERIAGILAEYEEMRNMLVKVKQSVDYAQKDDYCAATTNWELLSREIANLKTFQMCKEK